MQGKVTLPMGPKQNDIELLNYGTIDDTTIGYKTLNGKPPPGTLFYVRFNMATMCRAMSDVEIHCLHGEVHCNAATEDSSPTSMASRGVWIFEKDGTWCFYPKGYAITVY